MSLTKEVYWDYTGGDEIFLTIDSRKDKGFTVTKSWHDYYEILFIIRGCTEQMIDNNVIICNAWDIVVIPPGHTHYTKVISEDGIDMIVLLFMPNYLSNSGSFYPQQLIGFLNSFSLQNGCLHFPYENSLLFCRIFYELYIEFKLKHKGYKALMYGLIYELLGLLERSEKFRLIKPKTTQKDKKIIDICLYLEQCDPKEISLENASKKVGYSKEHFSRYFKFNTGTSFRSFVDYIKINTAKKLLLSEDDSIEQIAYDLGYESQSSFCRFFKRITGCQPSQFRAQKTKAI